MIFDRKSATLLHKKIIWNSERQQGKKQGIEKSYGDMIMYFKLCCSVVIILNGNMFPVKGQHVKNLINILVHTHM